MSLSFIAAVLVFLTTSCEEAEILLDGNLFNLRYAMVDASVPASQVRLWAEASSAQLDNNSDLFIPVEDPTTNLFPDRILLFGDPDSPQSSIEIHMNRGSGSSDHMNTVFIRLSGPFVENQEITTGTAEVTFGGLPNQSGAINYNFDGTADTYFSFTITNLNTVTNTIGGNFHMLLTNVGSRSSYPVSIYEGAFSWNLD